MGTFFLDVRLPLKDLHPGAPNSVSSESSRPESATNAFNAQTDSIGIALRKIHEGILAEPIPAEFLELLAKLEGKAGDAEKKQ